MADGMPTAAQVLTYTDYLAALFKASFGVYGLNKAGETNTLSSLATKAKTAILGDGSTSYGIGAPIWQGKVAEPLNNLVASFRFDNVFSRYQPLMAVLDNLVKQNLPTSWLYPTDTTQAHVFDRELTRKNAIDPLTPSTPSVAGTLTAVSNAAGMIPNVASGSAPRVVYTLVSQSDYNESLPAGECTQVALIGSQNAYTLAITGTVPTNVVKVRVYRSLIGGAAGVYYWDQDVTVSSGLAFPTITLVNNDALLRADITPPSWMSCQLAPDFGGMFALSYAGLVGGAGPLGFGLAVTQASTQRNLQYSAQHMLSAGNVLAGPASSFLGLGNAASSGVFALSRITGTNTQTATAAGLQTANNAAGNVQGFAGSTGVQARVLTALNTAGTVTISYQYLDAAHGQVPQTGTATSSAFTGVGIGSWATFAIPAGRLVISATVTSIAGGMNTGTFLLEPSIRAYLDPAFMLGQPNATSGGYIDASSAGSAILVPM